MYFAPLAIVNVPFTVGAVDAEVVVPELIVRLLKVVQVVKGIVLVAVSSTVPVPCVKVLVPFGPTASPCADKVPPFVMLITEIRLVLPALPPIVTTPDTVSVRVPLAANVRVDVVLVVPGTSATDAATAAVSTVTVCVPLIVTVSAAVGIPPPHEVHVPGALQFPVACELQAAKNIAGSTACSVWALFSVVMPKNSATESIKAKPVPVEALAERVSARPMTTVAAALRRYECRVGLMRLNIVIYFGLIVFGQHTFGYMASAVETIIIKIERKWKLNLP